MRQIHRICRYKEDPLKVPPIMIFFEAKTSAFLQCLFLGYFQKFSKQRKIFVLFVIETVKCNNEAKYFLLILIKQLLQVHQFCIVIFTQNFQLMASLTKYLITGHA